MPNDNDLSAVSETLFLPLYALAIESQRPDPIMADPETVRLMHRLDARFAGSGKPFFRRLTRGRLPRALRTSMALRIRQYDRYAVAFLEREPDAVVVNLGCGLDDRRRRVDNGRMLWFDLDLPEVIALRREYLAETDRMHFIESSVLDPGWIAQLPPQPGRRFLFIAEGLLMYLPPEKVRSLIVALSERFPDSELVAEVASQRTVRLMNSRLGRGKFRRRFALSDDVVYTFGLADSRDLERWTSGLVFLDDWTYFDEKDARIGWYRLLAWLPLFRRAQWTVHYRLGTSGRSREGDSNPTAGATTKRGGYMNRL